MTAAEFRAELKKGPELCGVYLFYGEEEYLKRAYLAELKQLLLPDEGFDVFNFLRLHGNDEAVSGIRRAVMAMPMMSERKLIVIEELEGKTLSTSDLAELTDCLALAQDSGDCVLVVNTTPSLFDAGTDKAPSKLLKAFCGEHLTAKKPVKGDKKPKKDSDTVSGCALPVSFSYQQPARLAQWAARHFAAAKVSASPRVCEALIAHTGRDMTTLSSEIEKLCCYALARVAGTEQPAAVSEQDIRVVVPHNKEINTFDFANAILNGDLDTAFYILSDMKRRKERPEIILASVSKVYTDLYLYKSLSESGEGPKDIATRLKRNEYQISLYLRSAGRMTAERLFSAVEQCAKADARIKSTALDAYEVLDELVIAIRTALK